jgi:hypothetical protein
LENWATVEKFVMFSEQVFDNLRKGLLTIKANLKLLSKQGNYEIFSLPSYRGARVAQLV